MVLIPITGLPESARIPGLYDMGADAKAALLAAEEAERERRVRPRLSVTPPELRPVPHR